MSAHYMSVNQALRLARTHTDRGALAEAKRAYGWILDKFPDNKRALEGLRALQAPPASAKQEAPREADAQLPEAKSVMALFREGRLDEAQVQAATLVVRFPRDAGLHNLLGEIEAKLGHSLKAIGSFRRAAALQPELIEARLNLGEALNEIGRHDEAVAILKQATREQPDSAAAHDLLGKALLALERNAEAVDSHRRATELNPDVAAFHINLGHALSALGRTRDATQHFTKAAQIDPTSGEAHSCLGVALTELGRPEDGIKACRKAVELNPGDAQAHVDLAAAQNGLRDHDGALASLEHALTLKQDHVGAHSDLCRMLLRARRYDDFRAALKRARRFCGEDDPRIRYWIAELAACDDAPQTAQRVAETIPDAKLAPAVEAERLKLLSRTSEHFGQYSKAFDFARKANETLKATPAVQKLDPLAYQREVEQLAASFSGVEQKPWTDAAQPNAKAPVFMIGFPGVDGGFIDGLLADHPDITLVEDKPMVARMRALVDGPADCDKLEALSPGEVEAMRRAYFSELHLHANGRPSGNVIVDKMPLNIVNAGLINRVFPSAKFVFTAHHPCNCVVSCYMRNFPQDNATTNFLDLETGATLYDRVMRLWAAYRKVLQLDVHTLPSEAPLADRRKAVRELLDFLGLDPAYMFVERGKTEPQRWENYRDKLEPVMPLLDSWARSTEAQPERPSAP